jgi:molybdopterin/thiamine biosynthesis adenylyltransferase
MTALKEAEEKQYAVAVIHNHSNNYRYFSETDDRYEKELFRLAFNRNGGDRPHLSLIITDDGDVIGRACDNSLNFIPLHITRIVGVRFSLHYQNKYDSYIPEVFHRQQLAFGKALIQDLSMLRVGIIGCGATGSATAFLLARLGVGQIVLIDNDQVERTNLNRLHGAKIADADAGKSKAEVLCKALTEIGIGCKARYIKNWVGTEECRDAIKSCDVLFGCTDDHDGRMYMNRLSYFYLTPLIDMGLSIKVKEQDPPEIEVLDGRVSYVFPGYPCMLCRELISPDLARSEGLKRSSPHEYEKLKQEAYVLGEKNPSPAVVTFTTEIATIAVNEFINRLQRYRTFSTKVCEIKRLFHRDESLKLGYKSREGCSICNRENCWGRGDMEPFIDRVN